VKEPKADMSLQLRWFKLKAAVQYSGIARERLKRLAKEGRIQGYKCPESGRGDWYFDRISIDQYHEHQIEISSPKQIVLDILNDLCL
jgi:hypothetical protein